jgi:hypothetical protein
MNIQFGIKQSPATSLKNKDDRPILLLKENYFILSKEALNLLNVDYSDKIYLSIKDSSTRVYLINATNSNINKSERVKLSKNGTFRLSRLYNPLMEQNKILNGDFVTELEFELIPISKYIVEIKHTD